MVIRAGAGAWRAYRGARKQALVFCLLACLWLVAGLYGLLMLVLLLGVLLGVCSRLRQGRQGRA
jgi:uncharacterized membrane protein